MYVKVPNMMAINNTWKAENFVDAATGISAVEIGE